MYVSTVLEMIPRTVGGEAIHREVDGFDEPGDFCNYGPTASYRCCAQSATHRNDLRKTELQEDFLASFDARASGVIPIGRYIGRRGQRW